MSVDAVLRLIAQDLASAGLDDVDTKTGTLSSSLDELNAYAKDAGQSLDETGTTATTAGEGLDETGTGAEKAGKGMESAAGDAEGLKSQLVELVASGELLKLAYEGMEKGWEWAKEAADKVWELVASAQEAVISIKELSMMVGSTPEQFQAMAFAARDVGVSQEEMAMAMRFLAMHMQAVQQGTGLTTKAFEILGIDVVDATGKLRDTNDVMAEVMDKFAAMPDGSAKTAMAMQLFGRAGAEMIPMLDQGSSALSNATKELNTFGLTITEKDIAASESFRTALVRLQESVESFFIPLGKELIPTATAVMNALSAAISDLVATADFKSIAEDIKMSVDYAASFLGTIVMLGDLVGGPLIGAFDSVYASVEHIGRFIYTTLFDLLSAIGNIVLLNWGDALDNVKNMLTDLGDNLTTTYGHTEQIAKGMGTVADITDKLVTAIHSGLTETISDTTTLEVHTNAVADSLKDVSKNAKDASTHVKDAAAATATVDDYMKNVNATFAQTAAKSTDVAVSTKESAVAMASFAASSSSAAQATKAVADNMRASADVTGSLPGGGKGSFNDLANWIAAASPGTAQAFNRGVLTPEYNALYQQAIFSGNASGVQTISGLFGAFGNTGEQQAYAQIAQHIGTAVQSALSGASLHVGSTAIGKLIFNGTRNGSIPIHASAITRSP